MHATCRGRSAAAACVSTCFECIGTRRLHTAPAAPASWASLTRPPTQRRRSCATASPRLPHRSTPTLQGRILQRDVVPGIKEASWRSM